MDADTQGLASALALLGIYNVADLVYLVELAHTGSLVESDKLIPPLMNPISGSDATSARSYVKVCEMRMCGARGRGWRQRTGVRVGLRPSHDMQWSGFPIVLWAAHSC